MYKNPKDTQRLEVKGWTKIYEANSKPKENIIKLKLGKENFKAKSISRDKDQLLMIKVSLYWKDITILNMYAFNNPASR